MAARVLIVGRRADRDALAELLALHGFEVATARPDDLAQAVRNCRAEVVIADVRVPELDGATVIAALASLTPPPRAILLSSRPGRRLATRGIASLLKPVGLDRLLAELSAPGIAA